VKEIQLNNPTAQKINQELQEPWTPPQPNVHPAVLTREKTPAESEEEAAREKLADKYQIQI